MEMAAIERPCAVDVSPSVSITIHHETTAAASSSSSSVVYDNTTLDNSTILSIMTTSNVADGAARSANTTPKKVKKLPSLIIDTSNTSSPSCDKGTTCGVPSSTTNGSAASHLTYHEKVNLGWYICAIASYKFALETVNVSISLFVLDRLNGHGNANSIWYVNTCNISTFLYTHHCY